MPTIMPPFIQQKIETNSNYVGGVTETSVITGAAHTKGSWTSLIDPVSDDAYWIHLAVRGLDNDHCLFDLGIANTGGGSETALIENINCGAASVTAAGFGKVFSFPCYIPAGTRVIARAQSEDATNTAFTYVYLSQRSLYPLHTPPWTTYGADTANSRGTTVTPGLVGTSWGTWTQITASSTADHHYWMASVDLFGDTTATNAICAIQIGTGPDSGNVTALYEGAYIEGNTETLSAMHPTVGYAPLPISSPIWVRLITGEATARGVIVHAA